MLVSWCLLTCCNWHISTWLLWRCMNSINSMHKDQKIIGTKLDSSKKLPPRRNEALHDMLPCQGASDVSGCSRDHSTPRAECGCFDKDRCSSKVISNQQFAYILQDEKFSRVHSCVNYYNVSTIVETTRQTSLTLVNLRWKVWQQHRWDLCQARIGMGNRSSFQCLYGGFTGIGPDMTMTQ